MSKTLKYEFHYNTMELKYGDMKSKLGIYIKNMKVMRVHFDTSDYVENNDKCMLPVNKNVMSKMKDELREMVGLRSKVYAIKLSVENINFDDYKRKKNMMMCMNLLRSYRHELYHVLLYKRYIRRWKKNIITVIL